MEVKMFVHNTLDAVEKEINHWLSEQSISIHHITQSQCERQGRFVFVLSVFYDKQLPQHASSGYAYQHNDKTNSYQL